MKKLFALSAFAATSLVLFGCGGPSAEEQEKLKQETLLIEETTIAVDSTTFEVKKTSQELDQLLNQL